MDYYNYTHDNYVKVWTAGACLNDEQGRVIAGFGVFFGHPNRQNLSEPFFGRVTNNNQPEIIAVTHACQQAFDAEVKRLHIITDSKFVIDFLINFIDKYKFGQWTTVPGAPIVNRDELEEMEEALSDFGENVEWGPVSGQEGIYGIEQANELARDGAQRYWDTNEQCGFYNDSASDSNSADDLEDY